jgi:hypothetical protein
MTTAFRCPIRDYLSASAIRASISPQADDVPAVWNQDVCRGSMERCWRPPEKRRHSVASELTCKKLTRELEGQVYDRSCFALPKQKHNNYSTSVSGRGQSWRRHVQDLINFYSRRLKNVIITRGSGVCNCNDFFKKLNHNYNKYFE